MWRCRILRAQDRQRIPPVRWPGRKLRDDSTPDLAAARRRLATFPRGLHRLGKRRDERGVNVPATRTHASARTHMHTHARTHARTYTGTHRAHIALPRANGARERRLSQSRKRSRGRSYLYRGCDISRGGRGGWAVRRKKERERERERVANLANLVGQTAWIGLLGCRSRRWLRHRANSIALLDIDGYGGDGGGDAAATTAVAAAGKRRLSIFPRSLHDRNTPVRVSPAGAPASPVGGLLGPARSLEPRFSSSSLPPPLSSSFSLSLSPSFSRAYLLAVPLTRVINGVSATDGRPHRGLAVIGNPVRK
jgi:hypothetical protein